MRPLRAAAWLALWVGFAFAPCLAPRMVAAAEQPPYSLQEPEGNENDRTQSLILYGHLHDGVDSAFLKNVLPKTDSTYGLGALGREWATLNVDTATVGALNLTNLNLTTMGGAAVATQADQETGTSTVTVVTPGRQQYHPSAAKAWVVFQGTGTVTIKTSYNVASITDGGAGTYTVNFSTPFSSVNYSCVCSATLTGGACRFCMQSGATDPTVSAFAITVRGEAFGTVDSDRVHVACFGDQ